MNYYFPSGDKIFKRVADKFTCNGILHSLDLSFPFKAVYVRIDVDFEYFPFLY